ncbi:exodeoxyribonuclease VII large subunit [Duganella sp. BJB488]|uniref:exodeoxyribonuclease VII large subunit n=1 Tax=unclassified Duganella TaxID=2636909 RepID=UPI000E34C473|nr:MULTISPECIES: exodeoxyribonuclease VII large subunit [unclassified Duganella]RFP12429.1 exodeoxyribonuclease VII large subunit [Duganella sp. BJB489]RFP16479.1 exodeoxyribonuclease VII large subunit [Duganella sp. BJB488]RFP30793.1 exodeoxyribonuclease VII large subunit [Duganella sp. BJB480]
MNFDDHNAPAPAAAPVMTVTALNQAVARLLERTFPLTWISGEVSNFTKASSGHWYFTLKDDAAQVRAVMFRGRAQYAGFIPREGDKVEVRALVTLYGARGDYQINVEAIRRAGVGSLFEAFQRLKEKLDAAGLFHPERKRALPLFPRTVGIVTSPQAAALRDVLTALKRRAPHVHIVLYPTPVQGQGAGEKIAAAIDAASLRNDCDVLIVCRGGGSIEDLWSFNDEDVAYAVANCRMPVISGVGHETDFTICDFAADLRAATPTAAAELAVTPRADWMASLRADVVDLRRAMRRSVGEAAQTLDNYTRRLLNPSAQIRQQRLKLLALSTAMTHANRAPLSQARFQLDRLSGRLGARKPDVTAARSRLSDFLHRVTMSVSTQLAQRRDALAALSSQLELLNPQRTLERGYAIVTDEQGAIVRAPAQLKPRSTLNVRLAEGSAQVDVEAVRPVSHTPD